MRDYRLDGQSIWEALPNGGERYVCWASSEDAARIHAAMKLADTLNDNELDALVGDDNAKEAMRLLAESRASTRDWHKWHGIGGR
jgi:transcription initiation factor TFIIIB Brf1 subunit/transcription initiation factor TFIIB